MGPCSDRMLVRDCIAMATSAPMRVAGKSWPTMASAMVSERAKGSRGAIVATDSGKRGETEIGKL